MKHLPLVLIATFALLSPLSEVQADQPRVIKAEQDIRAIESALESYAKDYGAYPTQSEGLSALIVVEPPRHETNTGVKYPRSIPKDPWGNDYQYLNPGVRGGKFDLWTYGADGRVGGEGFNADYGNWPGSFEKFHEDANLRGTIDFIVLWLGSGMLWGALIGLPIYLRGELKARRGEAPGPRAHLHILTYLVIASPLVLGLVAIILSGPIR